LNLTALRAGNTEKGIDFGRGEEAFAEGALGPGVADGTLGLFLLLAVRPGHRFTGADDEATTASSVVLFFLP
jgi:hypothetical protein